MKLVLIWFLILGLAFLNGALRELVLLPLLGKPYALLISGGILSVCILGVAALTLPSLGPITNRDALGIGGLWLSLTLLFEFGFGRLWQHKSWAELFAAYRFEDGNVWSIVLLIILFAPLFVLRVLPAK